MLKVGVIGCGYWGPNLIRNFSALDDTRVVAVSDLDRKRLDFVRKGYPAIELLTTDDRELLKRSDIDAIVIATPVSTHFELARQALESGRHVFVEKPFTATAAEAEKLVELADKQKLQIMVDHTFIYTGAVRKIRELIDRGELGELYYFDSVRVNLGLFQHDVNVVWDLAPHDISIMDFLLGEEPRAIACTGLAHLKDQPENIAYVSAYYDDQLLGHIHVNWLAPVKVRRTLLSGSKRMVIYDDMEPSEKIKVYDRGVDLVRDKDEIYDMLVQYRTGDMLAPKIDLSEALGKVAREFYSAIDEDRVPFTDGHAGLRVVRILEAADRSMKNGGTIQELQT